MAIIEGDEQSEIVGRDPFFDRIDYAKPVMFLKDMLSGNIARVKNDDAFTKEQAKLYYNKKMPKRERKWTKSLFKPMDRNREPGPLDLDVRLPLISELRKEKEDFMKKLAVLAIKRYNVMTGRNYEVVRLVYYNHPPCVFTHYYITFLAAAPTCACGKRKKTAIFQAKAVNDIFRYDCGHRFSRRIEICRRRRSLSLPSSSSSEQSSPESSCPCEVGLEEANSMSMESGEANSMSTESGDTDSTSMESSEDDY